MSKYLMRKILKLTFLVSCVAVIVCLVGIVTTLKEYRDSINEYEKLESYVTVTEEEPKEEVQEVKTEDTVSEPVEEVVEEVSEINVDFEMDFNALKDINSDLIGWIYYGPLELSYPVVIGKVDDYYEHYSFENEKNLAGAIFMDYLCKSNFTSFNSVIYGHNMRNGTMFGSLKRLMNEPELLEEDPYFYIFTDDEALKYKIVSAYYANKKSDTYNLELEYTLDNMKDYVKYMQEKGVYTDEEFFKEPVTEDLKICTLSTCHGAHSDQRTVIHGILVAREDRN